MYQMEPEPGHNPMDKYRQVRMIEITGDRENIIKTSTHLNTPILSGLLQADQAGLADMAGGYASREEERGRP